MKSQQLHREKVDFITPSYTKCRALPRGDTTVTTEHGPECRTTLESEIVKQKDQRDGLEKSNNRINEYIAKKSKILRHSN